MQRSRKLGIGLFFGILGSAYINTTQAQNTPFTDQNGLELGTKASPIIYSAELAPKLIASKTDKPTFQKSQVEVSSLQASAPQLSWGLFSFGSGIGASGFYLADIDSDAQQELVMGGGGGFGPNTFLNILKKSETGYDLKSQISLPNNTSIQKILGTFNAITDNHELFIAAADGKIYVYNLTAGRMSSSFSNFTFSSTYEPTSLLLGDADNDNSVDLIVVGPNTTCVYNRNTYELKYTYTFGGNSAAYGHFSALNANELALANGTVYQLQGNTFSTTWNYALGFGAKVLATDLNGDSLDEVVGAESWQKISAFDIKNQSVLWSKTTSHDISAIAAYDTTKDGIKEVFYGDGQWGSIHELSANSGTEITSISNPEHGVTNILVADIDKDNALEIIWGAGYSSTGPDHLYISDLSTKTNEWLSVDFSGPFYAVKIADVDNDGKVELVGISNTSSSGYGDGIIYIFDAVTKQLKWSSKDSNIFGGYAWTGIRALDVGDVDGDGKNEIVVGTDRLYDGAIYVLNGVTKSLKFSKLYDSGSPINAVTITDIDGDGKNEIIAGNRIAHTGSPGVKVYQLNGTTGEIVNQSMPLIFDWAGIRQLDVFDANTDGTADINLIVSTSAYIYDTKKSVFQQIGTDSYSAIAHGIVNSNSSLLLGSTEGWISYYDGSATVNLTKVCSTPITGLKSHTNTQVTYLCASKFGLYDLSSKTSLWEQNIGSEAQILASYKSNSSEQFLLGGENMSLYEGTTSVNNLVAIDSSLSTSFKKPVNTTLTGSGQSSSGKFYIVKAPAHGSISFTDRQKGELTYTPKGDFVGSDSFTFIIVENGMESNQAKVNISITNQSPKSASQNFSTHWQKSLSSTILATDDDGDLLTFKILSQPSRGTLTLSDATKGSFIYKPEGKSIEPVSFSYEITDGMAKLSPVSASISFTNNKPVAHAITTSGFYKSSSSGVLKADDEDGDTITYRVTENVSSGSLTIDATTGLYTYQPTGDKTYSVSFKYVGNDGIVDSEAQTVVINIEGKPKSSGGGNSSSELVLGLLILLGLNLRISQKKLK